jgi:hypothetical protein
MTICGVRCSVYLNNRYHDPTLGHFTTVDPLVGQTGQPYLYVNGNPTTLSDPSGLCAADVNGARERCTRPRAGTMAGWLASLKSASRRHSVATDAHTRRAALLVVPDGRDAVRFQGEVRFADLNNACDELTGCLFTTQTIVGRGLTLEEQKSTDFDGIGSAIIETGCLIPALGLACGIGQTASAWGEAIGGVDATSSESGLRFSAQATVLTSNWRYDDTGQLVAYDTRVSSQTIGLEYDPDVFKELYDAEVGLNLEASLFRLAPPIGTTAITEAVSMAWIGTDPVSGGPSYTGVATRSNLVRFNMSRLFRLLTCLATALVGVSVGAACSQNHASDEPMRRRCPVDECSDTINQILDSIEDLRIDGLTYGAKTDQGQRIGRGSVSLPSMPP